jgi:hypothetical protein
LGKEISFARLVAAAAAKGESAIGYHFSIYPKNDPTAGVNLNPKKAKTYTPKPGDGLVVLAEI